MLCVGLVLVGTFMVLTALDVGGLVGLWENAHWTAAGGLAALFAALVARKATGTDRSIALLVAVGTMAWGIGQSIWVVQSAFGFYQVPAPSDIGFLLLAPPIVVAFVVAVHGRLTRAEEVAVYFDAVAIFFALTAIILAIYGDQMGAGTSLGGTVAIAYPIFHLTAAAAGLVALLAARASPRGGGYLLLIGLAILGFAWVEWLRHAVVAPPPAGSPGGYVFSVGIVAVGLGARRWRLGDGQDRRFREISATMSVGLPLVALLASAMILMIRTTVTTDLGTVKLCSFVVIVLAGIRQSFLVHERGRLLDDSHKARTDLEIALVERAEADSRYQTLVERVPAAVYIDVADPGVTDGGHLAYMSPQIEAILGYPPEAFLDDPELWPRIIHPDDRATALAALADHWRTEQPLRLDYRMIAADGSIVWVHDEAYAMRDEATGGRRVSQGLLVDTTEQKRLEAQLLHDAFHDPLTGLANRALFREHLDRALDRSRRRRAGVAVLFLDVDDFKVVNDSLGHGAGDHLLAEVADRLTATIRTDDIAARQGGDEFTILVERVNGEEEAVALAERLAAAIRRPIVLEGRPLVVGVSIGIALGRGRQSVAEDLLAHADAAMYAAKEQGKGRYVVFDPSMQRRAKSRLETETELRAAIEAEDFEVHYQPIVELAVPRDRRFRGARALAARDPRARAAGRVHPARRGDRADRAAGQAGDRDRMPAAPGLA